MSKVTVRTKETVGDATYETEYVFESYEAFIAFEEYKESKMLQSLQGLKNVFEGGELTFLSGESPFENQEVGDSTEIKVSKKKAEPTKH